MAKWLEVKPAYGAKYNSQKAVKDAWQAGSDFQSYETGQFLNKQDAATYLADSNIMVRYADERKVYQVQTAR